MSNKHSRRGFVKRLVGALAAALAVRSSASGASTSDAPAQQQDALGNVCTVVYDPARNKHVSVDPAVDWTTYSWSRSQAT
jgi:hypothetical protein